MSQRSRHSGMWVQDHMPLLAPGNWLPVLLARLELARENPSAHAFVLLRFAAARRPSQRGALGCRLLPSGDAPLPAVLWESVREIFSSMPPAVGCTWLTCKNVSAPGRIRTYATASGGRCSIP